MSKAERIGKMKTRESRRGRVPELGYYFIVTDTKETEQNYMYGLRNSIPQSVQNKLVIKVFKSDTVNLVQTALSLSANSPQYRKVWIIFDRDQVKDFDKIISQLIQDKNTEIARLSEQIAMKDHQIAEKDKQLDQQQQLTAKALTEREQTLIELEQEKSKGFFAKLFRK